MSSIGEAAQDWSRVALAWDAHVDDVDEHSAPAVVALLDAVAVRPGDRVLELAAGPGSMGGIWSELVGASGAIVLSDLAPGMVEVAARRNASLDNLEVLVLDASAIDLPGASFDVVVCRMGLMFTPEPAIAFAEIRRVLRPGGRLGVLTWAAMEHNPWMTCVGMAATMNGLLTGGLPTGPGGIFSLADPAELATLATDAGFVDVAVQATSIVFESASVEAHVDRVSSLAGPLASILHAATPEQQSAVRKMAADLIAPYVTDSGVAVPGQALLVTGRAAA